MDCIRTICLYLKKYISDEQFENIFFDYINNFQSVLEENIFLNILTTNFGLKEEKISLGTKLRNYILKNYGLLYQNVNDSYVEHLIDSDKEDAVVEILKKKYEKEDAIEIDGGVISTQLELMNAIKQALKYPQFCGDNWDAIEDLMHDIILPKRLIIKNWSEVEKRFPQDAVILKNMFDRNIENHCVITYN